jgi:hypothetical protein
VPAAFLARYAQQMPNSRQLGKEAINSSRSQRGTKVTLFSWRKYQVKSEKSSDSTKVKNSVPIQMRKEKKNNQTL